MTTEVAIFVVVVNVVTIVEVMIVEVATGIKNVFESVTVVVEVLIKVRVGRTENFMKMQFVGLMILVMTDLMIFTQLTEVGYSAGEYTTEFFFHVKENFLFEDNRLPISRLFFLGTYPDS